MPELRDGLDNIGPWAEGITDMERLARLRSLRTICMCMFGALTPIAKPLMMAESLDAGELAAALKAFNAMPALDQRKILASYGKINLQMRRDAA
jgi:hypothetical protein